MFYAHDGSGFRVASPREILEHAQHLISRRFHRDGPLMDQVHAVRALLHVQLAEHPRSVFAMLLLDRRGRLIDYLEVLMDARLIRRALAGAEIPLLDYLIVGRTILSMAERGIL